MFSEYNPGREACKEKEWYSLSSKESRRQCGSRLLKINFLQTSFYGSFGKQFWLHSILPFGFFFLTPSISRFIPVGAIHWQETPVIISLYIIHFTA